MLRNALTAAVLAIAAATAVPASAAPICVAPRPTERPICVDLTPVIYVAPCQVNVGTCDPGADCWVNVGYCTDSGSCKVNVGYCTDNELIRVL